MKNGKLIEILPEYDLPKGVIYVKYTSRFGMLPTVRKFLEFLIEQFKQLNLDDIYKQCPKHD